MYLSKLNIKNFRCLKEIEVEFHQGLNILIGENDTGKTAIIDALRWCFELGSEQKSFFIRLDDIRIDENGYRAEEGIEFNLAFSDLSEEEQGVFIELLAIPENDDSNETPLNELNPELQLHVRFPYDKDKDQLNRPKYWGGTKEGQSVPPEVLELIYCTYLSALRDAVQDLRPSKGNQLSQLFLKLRPEKITQEKLAGQIQAAVNGLPEWKNLLKDGKVRIEEHLKEVTLSGTSKEADIAFVQREFRKIVEGLRVSIPIKPIESEEIVELSSGKRIDDFEIWQNGLGFNNLIYTATVLGNLRERKEVTPSSYVALLIEEPEAHLHPQLQNIFFRYLAIMAGERIQVFVTSHSPTITAKTHLHSLIVLQKNNQEVSAIPLRKVKLDSEDKKEPNRRYLERFLDVTKSQLFFAKGVILVEGISEALLLPCFADLLGKEKYNLEKNGIEVVNIGGVAFEPFARLFNSQEGMKRLNVRCSLITDDDVDPKTKEAKTNRAENARSLQGGLLKVLCAGYTFEYQLYLENPDVITTVYQDELNHTGTSFDGNPKEKAYKFVDTVKSNRDKAIFAQILAEKIGKDGLDVKVPEYIEKAIKWVVDGNGSE